jgi:hypothetical protein
MRALSAFDPRSRVLIGGGGWGRAPAPAVPGGPVNHQRMQRWACHLQPLGVYYADGEGKGSPGERAGFRSS